MEPFPVYVQFMMVRKFGAFVGTEVGAGVGEDVGINEGKGVGRGDIVGGGVNIVGTAEGAGVGDHVGFWEGLTDGTRLYVGEEEGQCVGIDVNGIST